MTALSDPDPSRRADAQRQRELETRVGIVEARAEQLTQLRHPVADGLRMDVQALGDA